MAEKRMFTKKITESDAFLDMPMSSQCLYFHLNMSADDDGFVNNPRKIQRMVGASDDDLRILISKRFILTFESGVIVIKHWKMHNYIQSDRYKRTDYIEELSMLGIKDNKSYTFVHGLDTECIQNGYVDQISIDKNSKDNIYDDFFDKIWSMYPKKKGKGGVSATQKKKLYSIGIEEMTRCIERFIADMKGTDSKYVMYGSTFFNTGYIDYLDKNTDIVLEVPEKKSKPIVEEEYIETDEEWLERMRREDESAV